MLYPGNPLQAILQRSVSDEQTGQALARNDVDQRAHALVGFEPTEIADVITRGSGRSGGLLGELQRVVEDGVALALQ